MPRAPNAARRQPDRPALTVGTSLAQIGEFSFILAGLGVALGIMPAEGQSLVLAAALITIAANSAAFATIEPARRWIQAHAARAAVLIGTLSDPVRTRTMATIARTLNPALALALKAGSEEEAAMLAREGVGTVFVGEAELARGMAAFVGERLGRS